MQASVAAGVAFVGYEHWWGYATTLAGLVGEGVQDAGDQTVGRDDPQGDNRNDSKRDDEGDHQPAQVRPTFPRVSEAQLGMICADRSFRSRGAFTLPALTLVVVSN